MKTPLDITQLAGGRQVVCVLGFGRSGLGAARLLLARGVRVRVLEREVAESRRAVWERLGGQGAEMLAGPHPPAALEDCALLVRSPGVPPGVPILELARDRGIPVRSELALAAAQIQTPLLAVTGTNGKSTTTAWTAHLLQRAGLPAIAAGNIGRSLAQAVLEEPPESIFVAEVSSFQLEDSPELRPCSAAILNIAPDHLDRHGSLEAYSAAKWTITRNQGPADRLVLGPGVAIPAETHVAASVVRFAEEDPGGHAAVYATGEQIIYRNAERRSALIDCAALSLPGPHNRANAMAAIALATPLLSDPAALRPGLADFAGLAHRLEAAGTVAGVRFVNDSKATNVDSLRVALESFPEPLVLIAGGLDKGGHFEEIGELVRQRVRHLILVGAAAPRIRAAWPDVPAETADDFRDALRRALAAAGDAGVVLLSPGCASFDMFRDYEERGEIFKALVAELAAAVVGGSQ